MCDDDVKCDDDDGVECDDDGDDDVVCGDV